MAIDSMQVHRKKIKTAIKKCVVDKSIKLNIIKTLGCSLIRLSKIKNKRILKVSEMHSYRELIKNIN